MMNNVAMFLSSGAGAFIGACIGSWLVTRWQFDRISELENTIEIIQGEIDVYRRRAPRPPTQD